MLHDAYLDYILKLLHGQLKVLEIQNQDSPYELKYDHSNFKGYSLGAGWVKAQQRSLNAPNQRLHGKPAVSLPLDLSLSSLRAPSERYALAQ